MSQIKSFTIYEEYYDLITLLKEQEQQELLLAICQYMFEDKNPNLNNKQMKIFNNLIRPLNKSKEQSKRRTNKKPKENQKETKKKPNDQPKENTSNDVYVSNYYDNNNYVVNVYVYIENSFSITISGTNYEIIDDWLKVFNEEIIKLAVDICVANGVRTIKYLDGILKNWKGCNYKTIDDVKKSLKKEKQLPEWFNKKIEKKEIKPEDEKKLKEILDKFGE